MSVGSDDDMAMDLEERDEQAPQDQDNENTVGEEEGEQMEQTVVEEMAQLAAQVHEVRTESLEELHLTPAMRAELSRTWNHFMSQASSPDAAGESLYMALFESAPTLQSVFTTPRIVMASRFRMGIESIVSNISNPAELKKVVESLGFNHLNLDVNVPRVSVFRDAICDLFAMELGESFTTAAREAWCILLNYAGGGIIYVRSTYAERFAILASSWATANKEESNIKDGSALDAEADADELNCLCGSGEKEKKSGAFLWSLTLGAKSKKQEASAQGQNNATGSTEIAQDSTIMGGNTTVPKNFHDMFIFNAVVMGYGNEHWMVDLLEHKHFERLVLNVRNAHRFQEECDLFSICIHRYGGTPTLAHFKTVMLATMRSLVPKDWSSAHEAAWSWLWESAERILKPNMGKPPLREKALERMLNRMTEEQRHSIRSNIFPTLFNRHPSAMDVFKASSTRLYFITDRVIDLQLEIYQDPPKTMQYISALGLRHVGYGVQTELFAPFVTACVDVLRNVIDDDEAGEEAFRWTLNLTAFILVRVIQEGSTVVMRAINANSSRQLKEAVSAAPRGKRAEWVLRVQVGKMSISPLEWAVKNASLEAAGAILEDLLTIRADRDKYYYGMESLFEAHPDLVKLLANEAPTLLPTLLDGLIWRSRTAEAGVRRVNYYVKHLIVSEEGSLSPFIEWIAEHGDPKIACHPVVVLVSDMLWSRVAVRTFFLSRSWFAFTLVVFVLSQSIIHEVMTHGDGERILIACLRAFIYVACMGQRIGSHLRRTVSDIKAGRVIRVGKMSLPEHFANKQDMVSIGLCVAMLAMLCTEPILHCISDPEGVDYEKEAGVFTQECHGGETVKVKYQLFSMIAMLLYFALLLDFSVLSTKVSAFFLVCSRVLAELYLFLFAMMFTTIAFSAAMAAEANELEDWKNMGRCFLSFMEVLFRVYDKHEAELLMEEPFAFMCVLGYCVVIAIFGINMLVAQMNCAYDAIYLDMLGFARLNRGSVLVEVMPSVPRWRWDRFVASLELHKRCEFGEGDLGLRGGIRVSEPASLHPTTLDRIKRYGGSTHIETPWPADEDQQQDNAEQKLIRLEKTLEKITRKVVMAGRRGASGSRATSSHLSGSASGSRSSANHSSSSGSAHGGSSGN